MLNKLEKQIMLVLYEKCISKESVLIDPNSIIAAILPKYNIDEKILDSAINNLALDNYIEVVNTQDKTLNKKIYCICLLPKGEAFKRELIKQRKTNHYLLGRKILLTAIGFVFALILRSIIAT